VKLFIFHVKFADGEGHLDLQFLCLSVLCMYLNWALMCSIEAYQLWPSNSNFCVDSLHGEG